MLTNLLLNINISDFEIRSKVEHYMNISSGDIDKLRDVISSQDLSGVDEIIIRRPAANSNNSSSSCSPHLNRRGSAKYSGRLIIPLTISSE